MQRKLPEIVLWQDLAGVLPLFSENRNITFCGCLLYRISHIGIPGEIAVPVTGTLGSHLPGISPSRLNNAQFRCNAPFRV
ncbi:hypothetical protein ACUXAV_005743 [Cupriavidus metallidurans]|jgi:hypothetical protein|uniref:hypothetical protein n=1 Tax=Cupriavidus TaxID=106589 RepID=UPI0012DA61B1|nr:hypothetical protein [Cupriavidus metallidurans]MDE4920006.1 hypothetical protein [Cupriavidus metallidurans]